MNNCVVDCTTQHWRTILAVVAILAVVGFAVGGFSASAAGAMSAGEVLIGVIIGALVGLVLGVAFVLPRCYRLCNQRSRT